MRIPLPHGNYCSPLIVSPSNWKSARKVKGPWVIYYRFFSGDQTKQIGIKGMNDLHDVQARRELTERLLRAEMNLLHEGYNPITRKLNPVIKTDYPIDPDTPFTRALLKTVDRLKIEEKTKQDIRGVLKQFNKAATQLDFHMVPIKLIKRRHLKLTLDGCEANSKRFTSNTFNHYRKYLSILFKELVELEVIETNYVRDISKQKTVSALRKTLTDEERIKVDNHLKKYPSFRRFTHIFFHSGARERELMRLKVKDVDLKNQVYKCVIKKGKQHREVLRTIKTIALPLWEELLEDANPNDYVFSRGLKPGSTSIRADQITKRWYKYVKKPLGIEATFYSLKHSHTSEIVDLLSEEDAAKINAHTNTEMVSRIYDIKKKDRQHERIKNVGNKF